MIDRGLLLTLAAMAAVLTVVTRLAPPRTIPRAAVWDTFAQAAIAGTLIGRVTALAFDDRAGLSRVLDYAVLRGGVEFWPGVAAAVALVVVSARRAGAPVLERLADLEPYGLFLYATYEAACLLRDGCFGPRSPVGLTPPGVGESQFPVAVALALAVVTAALLIRSRVRSPVMALAMGLAALAWLRFGAAFWLPKVNADLSRPQLESFAVAAMVTAGILAWCGLARTGRRPAKLGCGARSMTPCSRNGETAREPTSG